MYLHHFIPLFHNNNRLWHLLKKKVPSLRNSTFFFRISSEFTANASQGLHLVFPVSKIFHHIIAVSPVLLNLHPQLQIYFAIQQTLDLKSCSTSDFFQHTSLLSDDDPFMGISLADDCSINMTHFVVHLHLIDCYCDSMRDLLIQAVQCFLADNLCHDLALRLVCDCIFIKVHWTFI